MELQYLVGHGQEKMGTQGLILEGKGGMFSVADVHVRQSVK